jgi:hypothetical protein
MGNSMNGR